MRSLALVVPGNDHDLGAAVSLQQLVQESEAFVDLLRLWRKTEIERDQSGLSLVEDLEG